MFGKKVRNEMLALGDLVEGLPIPQSSDVSIKLTPGTVTITGSGQEFEIDISKLTLIDLKSDVEMEKIIKQSAPGMIIGAAAFGLIGAMVGGRVKTKNVKTSTHFVSIDYVSDGQKQIIMKTNDAFGAVKISDYFKELKPDANTPQTVIL